MKYSNGNLPIQCMMTQSTCYRNTREFTPKGILWHSTGANNPYIMRYVQPDDNASNRQELINLIGKNEYGNDWNHQYVQAGLNFWIGKLKDGSVATVQTMPFNFRPWGCGSGWAGSCNDTHIQFEICEDGLNDKSYAEKVYKEAVEMTAFLCKRYGINPLGVTNCDGVTVPTIIDHVGSYHYGLGSGHGDVQHWFPKLLGKTMDNVRQDVYNLMNEQPKPTPQPQPTPKPIPKVVNAPTRNVNEYDIQYSTHIENNGWLNTVGNGEISGSTGLGLRMESIKINIPGHTVSYQVHQQKLGDSKVFKNGQEAGVTGKGLRLEAIKIDCKDLKLQYRTHIQGIGWSEWTSNGKWSGTKGQGKRIEAIQIRIINDKVIVKVHQQKYGWQPKSYNSEVAGVTGKSLRLEAIKLDSKKYDLQYMVHQQTYGDSKWYTNGQIAGVTGKSLRLEGIAIKCKNTSVRYKVHIENVGWSKWYVNGEYAGTKNEGKRIEAIIVEVL